MTRRFDTRTRLALGEPMHGLHCTGRAVRSRPDPSPSAGRRSSSRERITSLHRARPRPAARASTCSTHGMGHQRRLRLPAAARPGRFAMTRTPPSTCDCRRHGELGTNVRYVINVIARATRSRSRFLWPSAPPAPTASRTGLATRAKCSTSCTASIRLRVTGGTGSEGQGAGEGVRRRRADPPSDLLGLGTVSAAPGTRLGAAGLVTATSLPR